LSNKLFIKESKNRWKRIVYFFPIQLLWLHFKRNHLLMFFWLLLFMYVTSSMGAKFGVPYLFLAPEYMGGINGLSYLILGLSIGAFLMAFNIYSYILHAHEFKFLATLSKPFLKFCYNNLIIPAAFYLTLVFHSYHFQISQELFEPFKALYHLFMLSLGILFFIVVSMLYFTFSNKNLYKISGKNEEYYNSLEPVIAVKESNFMKETKWYKRMSRAPERKVVTYIFSPFSIRLARSTNHYDKRLLMQVFKQNNISASKFEMGLILSFLSLSIFREVSWMNIPAGGSILIAFTLFLMIFSSLHSWFKGWTLTLLIGAFFVFNFLSNTTDAFKFRNYAYGIDYSVKSTYTWDALKKMNSNKVNNDESYQKTLVILNNWKTKNTVKGSKKKPKLILLNISGGGLRASMYTMRMMQHLDKVTGNSFFDQTQLITGASGGMLGASYYRELKRLQLEDKSINVGDTILAENIARDLLNPLTFGIATTDFLFRYQTITDGSYTYTKDRGYSFEKKLVENLEGVFEDTRLYNNYLPEKEAQIPMLIYSPAVVNDGRRILISPQPISYLTYFNDSVYTSTYHSMENLEFTKLFEDNNPLNLRMTSAMRMNATFPYILPMVSLPTEPPIEVMDAGVRDNYGLKTSLDFMRVFKDWIAQNTSGVILIELRDKQKYFDVENPNNGTIISRLFAPAGAFYANTTKTHDYTNDQILSSVPDWFDGEFDVVTFYMAQDKGEEISMSWHLTSLDKKNIRESINRGDNPQSTARLLELLK
jgi:hypothetical protein